MWNASFSSFAALGVSRRRNVRSNRDSSAAGRLMLAYGDMFLL
jgi:hypothetical protein